jgi:flagellar biosynthesis protein FlhB
VPDESFGEKTEAPTPQRLEEAKQRGQVPRSSDLTGAIVLLAGVSALALVGGNLAQALMGILRSMLHFGDVHTLSIDTLLREAGGSAQTMGLALAPVLGALVVAAIAANLIQSGPVFSVQPITPSLEKLSPLKGFGRIFSKRALMRFVSSMLKLVTIIWVSFVVISADWDKIVALSGASVQEMATTGGHLVIGLGLKVAAIFVVLALLDFLYQRWQFTQDLRMTKQEVREEMKRMEGDPLIREQRRHIQRQMVMQRMSAEVPKADAVITNPTHYAIAIRYDADTMAAPKVVAKGADYMAKRIREIAMEHDVPIIEKAPLARALYPAVEVGQEVPLEFYRAVAEVLAFVYQLQNRQFSPTAV